MFWHPAKRFSGSSFAIVHARARGSLIRDRGSDLYVGMRVVEMF